MTGWVASAVGECLFEGSAAMIALGTALSVEQRPVAARPTRHVSEWRLSVEHSLQIGLRVGDTLHINHGMVWLGADAPMEPIALSEGATYTAASDAVLLMIGMDNPRVTVCSGRPVPVSVRADYGAWRYRSLIAE